jgi:hypothetical protein
MSAAGCGPCPVGVVCVHSGSLLMFSILTNNNSLSIVDNLILNSPSYISSNHLKPTIAPYKLPTLLLLHNTLKTNTNTWLIPTEKILSTPNKNTSIAVISIVKTRSSSYGYAKKTNLDPYNILSSLPANTIIAGWRYQILCNSNNG